jgi:hypothetical protein
MEQLQRPSTQFRNGSSKTLNYWYESEFVFISESKFFAEKIEHLEYWITRKVIQPLSYNVKMNAISNIAVPKPKRKNQ